MANPQAEDGHCDIANEIVEALYKVNLSAYESRLLWFIFRKTYGWHKKSDRISYSQFGETGLKWSHIARTLKRLKSRNMITITGTRYKLEYAFQKDWELWKSLEASELPKEVISELPNQASELPIQASELPKEVVKSLPKEVVTKEKKETIQKKLYKRKEPAVSFEEYKETLRQRYAELDFDNEYQKFHLYWFEGTRKCHNPKLALHNWLDKARDYKKQGDKNGIRANRQQLPTSYTTPEQWRKQHGGGNSGVAKAGLPDMPGS